MLIAAAGWAAACATLAALLWPGPAVPPAPRHCHSPALRPPATAPSAFFSLRRWVPFVQHPAGLTTEAVGAMVSMVRALAGSLDTGMPPREALIAVCQAHVDFCDAHAASLRQLCQALNEAARTGAAIPEVWRHHAKAWKVPALESVARAWELSDRIGAPLAPGLRTAVRLVEHQLKHDRAVSTATAGAHATIRLLTWLPLGGPLLATGVGLDPFQLYGSPPALACLVVGAALLLVGRWWVGRMVQAVAPQPSVEGQVRP